MVPHEIPSAFALALLYFRSKSGLSRKKLATLLKITDPSLLTRYEKGRKPLSREQLEELLGPTAFGPDEIDIFLFADDLISAETHEAVSPVAVTMEEHRRINQAVLSAMRLGADMLRAELIRQKKAEKVARLRRQAEDLWERMRHYPPEDRRNLVTTFPEYRQWALVDKISHESVRKAAHDADEAMELADLALLIALVVPGGDRWRFKVEGYAWLFVGNARRVANRLEEADEAFHKAKELLKKGAGGDFEILDESRRLDLEASLRKDQQRYPEALALLDESLAVNDGRGDEVIARLLLNKEHVFERMGNHAAALATLAKAAPYVERSGSRHLLFALYFNTADNLHHLERYEEAAALLEKIQALALDDALALVRVLWLGGRIAAGQGRNEEAMISFRQVKREFTERRLPYDAALASLDLAVLLLRQGVTVKVRVLAVEMAWIFAAKGIDREALASLSLFCEAAKRDSATVELAREVIVRIEKVRCSVLPPWQERRKDRADRT